MLAWRRDGYGVRESKGRVGVNGLLDGFSQWQRRHGGKDGIATKEMRGDGTR